MIRKLRWLSVLLAVFAVIVGVSAVLDAKPARAAEGEFYLQVSPSPLVATLKPGEKSTLTLKVRNAGTLRENLTIIPKKFTVSSNGKVTFDETKQPEIASWLTFGAKNFSIDPGQWFDQKVTIDVPKEAGFSYSLALVVTRQDTENHHLDAGQKLKAQVAVFTLINIDRPGATRGLKIGGIESEQPIYEYLPATINLRLKNTGNTIVQPAGDVFFQRGSNDITPITTKPVNESGGYILPDTTRTLAIAWDNGFPMTKLEGSDSTKSHTDWDIAHIGDLRFGYYTAKAVVLYNDGARDVPLSEEVGFWVVPWKLLLIVLVVVVVLGFGLWSLGTKLLPGRKPKKRVRLGR